MVCVPCIVIPFVLWVFHKYIRPIVIKFLPEKWLKYVEGNKSDKQSKESCNGVEKHENGAVKTGGEVATGGEVIAGGGSDKKND